ncbi:hypothetical protein SDC9_63393 [bioreactor metagenome]|uniref:Uncharacterized protein n=1 Tax=bioreactor metagenome TaxID=1076179 RepID=A0A644XMI1_9ZZZZ
MGNILGPLPTQFFFTLQGFLQRPGCIRNYVKLHDVLALYSYSSLAACHPVQSLGKIPTLLFQRFEKQESQQRRNYQCNQQRPDEYALGRCQQGSVAFHFRESRQIDCVTIEKFARTGFHFQPSQILDQAELESPASARSSFSLAVRVEQLTEAVGNIEIGGCIRQGTEERRGGVRGNRLLCIKQLGDDVGIQRCLLLCMPGGLGCIESKGEEKR